jgi:uncharacterized protein (TIGR02145 family)
MICGLSALLPPGVEMQCIASLPETENSHKQIKSMKTAKLFLSPLRRAKSRRDGTLLTVCFSLRAVLLPALRFFFCANLPAQVTMGGLEDPKSGAILDLNSSTKGGLLLSNVELLNLYTIPYSGTTPFPGITAGNHESVKGDFAGAIVYHTGENGYPAGVYLWNGENWSPAGEDCRALTAADLTLKGLPFAKVNTAASFSVSSKLSARCSEGETFTWSVSGGAIFTPSSGAATSVTFPATGTYTVTVAAQNAYMPAPVTKTLQVIVNNDGSLPVTLLDGVYGIVGQTCLDAKGTKPPTQSIEAYNARVDAFESTADYTKTYRFIHNDAYGNLNLILLDPAGLVESMTSPVPDSAAPVMDTDKEKAFTMTFKSDIKTRVLSNGASLTVKLIASYTNNIGSQKVAYLEIRVEDGTCVCPAKVGNDAWKNFMCHNLGGLDIISPLQLITYEHHGDWYRFGAKNYSLKNEGTNNGIVDNWTITSHSDYPFYTENYEWPDNHADPAFGNPCPAGWKLPTIAEWENVINYNTPADVPDTWVSSGNQTFCNLKKLGDDLILPVAGSRTYNDGSLSVRGGVGYCWSSTHQGGEFGRYVAFFSELQVSNTRRSYGFPVRCVQAE